MRLGSSQPGATLERKMPWERPPTQSAHLTIIGSNRRAHDRPILSPSTRAAAPVMLALPFAKTCPRRGLSSATAESSTGAPSPSCRQWSTAFRMHSTAALSLVVMTQKSVALGSIGNGSPNMEPSREVDVAMSDEALQQASADLAISVGGPRGRAAAEGSDHSFLAARQDGTFGSFSVSQSAIFIEERLA